MAGHNHPEQAGPGDPAQPPAGAAERASGAPLVDDAAVRTTRGLLSLAEVLALTGLSASTLRVYQWRERFPRHVYGRGRRRLWKAEHVLRYLAAEATPRPVRRRRRSA